MAKHVAAALVEKGKPLEILERDTPSPGPEEILVEMQAVALNPIDVMRRNIGMLIKVFPTVLGSDGAGIVVARGPGVTSPAVGDRVVGLITCFFSESNPNYGAMQKKALVRASNVAKIPDAMGFPEATLLPIAICTVFSALITLGVDYTKVHAPSDKQALLVHGASGNVGSLAVQVFSKLGFTVYATASPTHHAMVQSLGAAHVFDYKQPDVGKAIAAMAQRDEVRLTRCLLAVGSREIVYKALEPLRGTETAIVAHAPAVPKDAEVPDGFQVTFIVPPEDAAERDAYFGEAFAWLQAKLAAHEIVPSPSVTDIEGGLEAINGALDRLAKGVSGTKLVASI